MSKSIKKVQKYIYLIFCSIGIAALFLGIDYAEVFPISPYTEFDSCTNIWQNLRGIDWLPSMMVGFYTFIVWVFYINLKNVKALFREFIVPLAIVVFTLCTGTLGFLQTRVFNLGDSFFAAANLLTLNTSVFKSFLAEHHNKVNFWIENARLMGGIFLSYAFVLALSLATGKENVSRIKFRLFREYNKLLFKITNRKKTFYVVIGDGEKAVSLALNLVKGGQKVAFLHQGFGEYTENIIEETDIWYLKGNASSQTGLIKTYFHLAEKVYIINDSDDENFRTVQEMEEILKQNQKETKAKWFVHLIDLRKKYLLTSFVKPHYIQTFDIHQNIARKLVNDNPINRFENGSIVAQVIVVGFGQLAEAIVMQCLRIGHFTGKRYLQIKVYFTKTEQEKVNDFKLAHPELFKLQGIYGDNNFASVQHYTFFQHSDTLIDFEELPLAESALINPNFSLYALLKPTNCVSLYACLDGGIDNAAFLGTVLPRIAWEKQKDSQNDVKAYCQYNFPDEMEKKHVQDKLNDLTKQVNVVCFGSYLEECTDENIENEDLDIVAKQIGKLYSQIYDKLQDEKDHNLKITYTKKLLNDWKTDDLDAIWEADKEINRESNRQAADHAKVKLLLFNITEDTLHNKTYDELIGLWNDKNLQVLGELEHRRWCAEKLLLGWLPIRVSKDEWNANKSKYQNQKLHLHLVTFEALDDSEKNKDYTQVLGLPFFMRKIKA